MRLRSELHAVVEKGWRAGDRLGSPGCGDQEMKNNRQVLARPCVIRFHDHEVGEETLAAACSAVVQVDTWNGGKVRSMWKLLGLSADMARINLQAKSAYDFPHLCSLCAFRRISHVSLTKKSISHSQSMYSTYLGKVVPVYIYSPSIPNGTESSANYFILGVQSTNNPTSKRRLTVRVQHRPKAQPTVTAD